METDKQRRQGPFRGQECYCGQMCTQVGKARGQGQGEKRPAGLGSWVPQGARRLTAWEDKPLWVRLPPCLPRVEPVLESAPQDGHSHSLDPRAPAAHVPRSCG